MRTGRIIMENEGYYHVISHLVPGTPRLTELQKEQFQAKMRVYETFCGVNILTHSILDTHFHVLIRIPERKDLSETEIRERMTASAIVTVSDRNGKTVRAPCGSATGMAFAVPGICG